jgi:hypothetical protein
LIEILEFVENMIQNVSIETTSHMAYMDLIFGVGSCVRACSENTFLRQFADKKIVAKRPTLVGTPKLDIRIKTKDFDFRKIRLS